MNSLDNAEEKLTNFNIIVLDDVASERNEILQEAKKEIEALMEEKKLELKKQADEMLKKGKLSLEKEKNTILTEAVNKSKQLLIKAREDMTAELYEEVKKLLVNFVTSDDYYNFLSESIKSGLQLTGDGEKIIYLKESDLLRFSKELDNLLKDLNDKNKYINCISYDVLKEDNVIGGCKIFNKTKEIIVDNTLIKRLEEAMEDFINSNRLKVEMN